MTDKTISDDVMALEEKRLRAQCLELASRTNEQPDAAIKAARDFYAFVRGSDSDTHRKAET